MLIVSLRGVKFRSFGLTMGVPENHHIYRNINSIFSILVSFMGSKKTLTSPKLVSFRGLIEHF